MALQRDEEEMQVLSNDLHRQGLSQCHRVPHSTSNDETADATPAETTSSSFPSSQGAAHTTAHSQALCIPLPIATKDKHSAQVHRLDSPPMQPDLTTATEKWASPEESEGDYVRKTYMHFDKIGVQGDGLVEGKEWTRHRASDGIAPWDLPASSGERSAAVKSAVGSTSLSRSPSRKSQAKGRISSTREEAASAESHGPPSGTRTSTLDPSSAASGLRSPRSSLQGARRSASASASTGTAATKSSSPLAAPPTTAGDYLHPSSHRQDKIPSPASPRFRWRPSSRKSEGSIPPQSLSSYQAPSQDRNLDPPISSMSTASSSTSLASTSLSGLSRSTSTHLHPNGGTGRSRRVASPSSHHLSPLTSPNGALSGRRMSESEMSELTELDSEEWGLQQQEEQTKRSTLDSRQFGGAGSVIEEEEDGDDELNSWKRLDRYGFFSRDWSGQHGRICILPATTFSLIPSPGAAAMSTSSKATAVSRAARSVVNATETAHAKHELSIRSTNVSRGVTPIGSPHLGNNSGSSASRSVGTETPASSSGEGETVEQHPKADAISALRCRSQNIQRNREQGRIEKWAQMLLPGERQGHNVAFYTIREDLKGSSKLEDRVFKGIPDRWRAAAWWALVEMATAGEGDSGDKLKLNSDWVEEDRKKEAKTGVSNAAAVAATVAAPTPPPLTGLKRRLSSRRPRKSRQGGAESVVVINGGHRPKSKSSRRSEPLEFAVARRRRQDHIHRFGRLLEVASPHDVQIDLDVPRTISNHVHFHTRYGLGQRSLFKVLHCFSLLCPQCGYCQGMGSLAATLLSYYPEEQAYALLVALHDSPKYALHDLFSPGFPGLMESFQVQESLMRLLLPKLNEVMQNEGLVESAYATRWYITLFSSVVPFETQLRLWDVFLLVGKDIIVLFALAVLHSLSLTVLNEDEDQVHTTTPSPVDEEEEGQPPPPPPPPLDFEKILSTLNQVFVPQDDQVLFHWIQRLMHDRRVVKTIRVAREEGKDKVEAKVKEKEQ